ncbi:MAG: sensor histidine kinase [Telluria sp.]
MGRLFWKFFAAILLAQFAASVGVGAVFWLRDQSRQQAAAFDASPPAADHVAGAAMTLKHGGPDALRDLLREAHGPWVVLAVDETGREILDRPVEGNAIAQAEATLAHGSGRAVVQRIAAPNGHSYLLFARARQHGNGFRVGHPGPGGFGAFRPFAPIVAALAASLLVSALLAWYFSRPIRSLRAAFEAAAAGKLEPRFQHLGQRGGDELSDLGRDFDRMSGRLRTLMDAQRRLLHDVSHELRSPLARLQAAIGLAHQQPEKAPALLERIERESVRMDTLVGELLTLARLDAPTAPPQGEDFALMELLEALATDAGFEAEQSGRTLVMSGTAAATVRGSPNLVWRAIDNVVRNAIKHSPEGGTVDIALRADGRHAHVVVLDRGPGIAEDDLEAVFEPFFRSAVTANNVDGHGLGLAIARRVIIAHGGAIRARNREGGGLAVDISLPAAR